MTEGGGGGIINNPRGAAEKIGKAVSPRVCPPKGKRLDGQTHCHRGLHNNLFFWDVSDIADVVSYQMYLRGSI